ncbi:MAG TPA: molybdopterin cofactor-binding domain-containing protein [Gemmatimonadaceae bacterium]|nr:molybdopterin cofactor-binding domain-containing protein [Gemmatimonadaceae bacterium]
MTAPHRPTVSWAKETERVEQRIVIESDGTIVARSGKVEYGQGIRTGFARIVAEELAVPPERVRVELGETDRVPWDMGTFGSLSTATDGSALRAASIFARHLLLSRASTMLGVPEAGLRLRDGVVRAEDGRTVTYAALVETDPLVGVVPAGLIALSASIVDAGPSRLEAVEIVTGRARYPADVRLPGMLRGHVLRAPRLGSRLAELDERDARAMPGVVAVVRDGNFVGVVAERGAQAVAAVEALHARWESAGEPSAEPFRSELRRDGGVDAALASAAHRLSAAYHVPHISHGSISPSAAVADVREAGADLYVATQRPFGLRDEVAALLGMLPERVHVHPQMMSGLFGRGNMVGAAADAARLSRAVKRPVLVQWTRAEEFAHSPQRPVLDAAIDGAVDANGVVAAWRYRVTTNPHAYGGAQGPPRIIEMTSGRNAEPPYRLGRVEITLSVVPAAIRTGAFRSLAAAPNVFAIESFLDELAHAAGRDPLAFRLGMIDDPRLRRVLETVAKRSAWGGRPRPAGRGIGIACAIYHGTYVAEVAEVSVAADGQVRLEKVWCAVDAGRLVHPDGARNQIEGGIQQAASWTLLEALSVRDGQVTAATWSDYPIATFLDAPRDIDVEFVGDPRTPSTGVGEPGSVPTAAAIANAVFAASGARVRTLPLTAAAVRAAQTTRP